MKLELSIHAINLKNVAGAFKGTSDPFAVVTVLATQPGSTPNALGKTEVIQNTLNPKWVKVFELDYELGIPQKIAINIFDEVTKGTNKAMGSAVFDVAEVLGSRGNTKAKKLASSSGTIFANVRKSTGSGTLRFQVKGQKLANVEGMFGKSDPFFELSRKVDNAGGLSWDNVYRSKHKNNTLDPVWDADAIGLNVLCGGDLDSPIQIDVYDYEKSGKHKFMGKTEVSVNGMKSAATSGTPIVLKNKNKDCGKLIFTRCDIEGVQQAAVPATSSVFSSVAATAPPLTNSMANMSITNSYSKLVPVPLPTTYNNTDTGRSGDAFVDYVSGGCELNVVVAIDFTGSNGDPRVPGTLHYLGGPERNDYQKAIAAIVSILAKYDSDQKFPVFGFGAKYGGVVRHCFQCGPTEEASGLSGVLDAYSKVFSSGLIMSSPTLFDDVIDQAAARARQSFQRVQQMKGQQSYTILLIVTDGAVSDPARTVAALDRASDAPLSVVIVGVGSANFSSMQFLDDYNNNGGSGKRDIVQFVEFNKHKHDSTSLTSATLQEIPQQLSGFFQSRGIGPLPPMSRTDSTISVGEAEQEIDLSLDIRENDVYVKSGGDDFVNGFNASR
jgi:flavin-binding protein dodecin